MALRGLWCRGWWYPPAPPRRSLQPVFTAVDALDLELLPRLDAIPLADLGGQNDLALRGNRGFHLV